MSLCKILLRGLISAFFLYNAYLSLTHADTQAKELKTQYSNFEKYLQTSYKFELPQALKTQNLAAYAWHVAVGAALVQGFCAFSAIFCGFAAPVAGLIFLAKVVLHTETFKLLSTSNELKSYTPLLLAVSLSAATFALPECLQRSESCGALKNKSK